MRLLLTSNGLCNKTIVKALGDLLGKPFSKSSIAFIPTAANVETGSKYWLINDLGNCLKAGFEKVDIVDISALTKDQWQPRFESAEVLLFSGGNTFYLMYWVRKSGLENLLSKYLKNKVYVGISAGSMVTGQQIILTDDAKKLYYPKIKDYQDERGLGLVNFSIRPHLNNVLFSDVKKEVLEKLSKEAPETIYALDDESALVVNKDKVEVVTEGTYLKFN